MTVEYDDSREDTSPRYFTLKIGSMDAIFKIGSISSMFCEIILDEYEINSLIDAMEGYTNTHLRHKSEKNMRIIFTILENKFSSFGIFDTSQLTVHVEFDRMTFQSVLHFKVPLIDDKNAIRKFKLKHPDVATFIKEHIHSGDVISDVFSTDIL